LFESANLTDAFASEKSAFCRKNARFFAENREQNPKKEGCVATFPSAK
jgi:hypothetical protein